MQPETVTIDGLQYCNWDRELFEDLLSGGLTAIHATVSYWENTDETNKRLDYWDNLFYEFNDLDEKTVLYGLGAIKGIGESLVNAIIEARKIVPFNVFYDFCRRIGSNRLNKRILVRLIGSGAIDSLGKRETLFNLIEASLKRAEQSVERSESQISDLFSEDLHQEKDMDLQSKTPEAVSYTHLTLPTSDLV